ncbi:hypothetical protein ARMGADRAFT_567793 [Armillaria gallica]|uniref:Uncharacterized protein n=1 Tax=Armillaria gallica TaxID=47427 RepID=A0A2H3E323_ARMGA|nr:hypothetical protein ARMGADRAFT_567793 [Armillaria gallica]
MDDHDHSRSSSSSGSSRQGNGATITSHYPLPCASSSPRASTSTATKQIFSPDDPTLRCICELPHDDGFGFSIGCEDCLRWAAPAFSIRLALTSLILPFFCKLYRLRTRLSCLDGATRHVLGFTLESTSPTSGAAGYAREKVGAGDAATR